jgi:hypothetical protein
MSKNNLVQGAGYRLRELPLDRRYGEIGISAVIAALQFKSTVKKPARAPIAPQLETKFRALD